MIIVIIIIVIVIIGLIICIIIFLGTNVVAPAYVLAIFLRSGSVGDAS